MKQILRAALPYLHYYDKFPHKPFTPEAHRALKALVAAMDIHGVPETVVVSTWVDMCLKTH